MMEKLMVDSVKTWAEQYKVGGFRFDLMGHHMKENMEKVRDSLHALNPEQDGIDGKELRSYSDTLRYLQDVGLRVHPEDRKMSGTVVARALAEGTGFKHEERIVRPDGSERLVRTHGQIVRDEGGRALKLIAACLDVTEQRDAEAALQSLTRRLVQAEESERRRIAGELHDRVGQTLSALNINLDILLGMLGEQAPADVRMRLRDSLALVDGTLQSIENVMAELRPPLLEEYGVGAALGWHAEEFSRRTGIGIEFEDLARQRNRELPREAAVALFRISQEALNNIAKHANARRVTQGRG